MCWNGGGRGWSCLKPSLGVGRGEPLLSARPAALLPKATPVPRQGWRSRKDRDAVGVAVVQDNKQNGFSSGPYQAQVGAVSG